jgi:ParB family chromosome partitioning protein
MDNAAQKTFKKPIRPALGRGLSALISAPAVAVAPQSQPQEPVNSDAPELETAETKATLDNVRIIDRTLLVANPNQPRQTFTDLEIDELCASIKTHGVLQPILVRPVMGSDKFEIVAGERRFRAATRAELPQVPVIIKEMSNREALEVAIVENVQRQNLSPLEEARSYQRLMDEFSMTAQEISEKVGKDRASIANIVRVLKLPEVVQEMLNEGRITLGHAKAILTVKEPSAQIGLAKKVEEERLSVRALEAIVSREVILDAPKKHSDEELTEEKSPRVSPYPEVEERLRNALGTKVTLKKGRGTGGVLMLHYYSEEELNRLIDVLDNRA